MQLTTTLRYVAMTRQLRNYGYKVTVNHVTLCSMGKIFDMLVKDLTFSHLVMGFERPSIGSPHYQMYIGGTPYTQFEQVRKIISTSIKELHTMGIIDCPHATVVAFPVEVDEKNSEEHLLTYCKKDGMYIHQWADGDWERVECSANNWVGSWMNADKFSANTFDYFRENAANMPSTISHRRSWHPS